MRDKSVIVAFIHPGTVTGDFARSLANLQKSAHDLIAGTLVKQSGPLVAEARNEITEYFVNSVPANDEGVKPDWLWFLDADMSFDRDILHKMILAADPNERPIISGLAFSEIGDLGIKPVMGHWTEEQGVGSIYTVVENALMEVDTVGGACLLVHRRVLEKMRLLQPFPYWWGQFYHNETRLVGEDIAFCLRARDLGFKINVHTGVALGHTKQHDLNLDMWRRQQWVKATIYRTLDFVVTGTGRSATGYTAMVFNRLGIPTGHEEAFNPYETPKWGLRGECSWMAVPHLERLSKHGVLIVNQTRHPLKVLNSLCGNSALREDENSPYRAFKTTYMPELTFDPERIMEDAMFNYVNWNQRVDEYADVQWRIEDFGPDTVATVYDHMGEELPTEAEVEWALDVPSWQRNKHAPADHEWGDFPDGELKSKIEEMAEGYGYDM